MKPTQAQIEAAAKVIYGMVDIASISFSMEVAKAALTAAAEVGDDSSHEHFFINGICSHCGRTVAEVEDGSHERADKMRREFNSIANHTIERCAQVAEEIDTPSTPVGRAIAAAIRAMKS